MDMIFGWLGLKGWSQGQAVSGFRIVSRDSIQQRVESLASWGWKEEGGFGMMLFANFGRIQSMLVMLARMRCLGAEVGV